MTDLDLDKTFEDPELRFYLDSKNEGNEKVVKEMICFVHLGGETGIRHRDIKHCFCPPQKKSNKPLNDWTPKVKYPIENPNQLERFLKELVLLRLFQPIMKNEPGPRAKKKRVKPSIYYRIWKGFLTRTNDPSPDELNKIALKKEARIALRYAQLRDANNQLMAAKALMVSGGPYDNPQAAIDKWIEKRGGVSVEPTGEEFTVGKDGYLTPKK